MKQNALLFGIFATAALGCSLNAQLVSQHATPEESATGDALPYAASGPDHPSLDRWAERAAAEQAAVTRGQDLRQTRWLFQRDAARPVTVVQPLRGTCVTTQAPAEPRLLPPPTGLGVFASEGLAGGIPGIAFGGVTMPQTLPQADCP